MKVLIAEDDAISRLVINETVENLGHECLVAGDGLEAWELFQNHPEVEVVISDWMMPGIDGIEFCRRVREVEREGYTFFIFLTALSGKERLLEGMRAGADEYLTKPLDKEQLQVRLTAASRVTSLQRHLSGESNDTISLEAKKRGVTGKEHGTLSSQSARKRTGIGGTKIWDFLISQGRVSEEQLQRALEVQKRDRREFGKILVSLGSISEADLAHAQAQRLSLDYINLSERDVDPAVVNLVPEKVLRKYGAVPLRVENKRFVVAMSDPANIYALDDLKMISGYPIVPVVVTEEDVRKTQIKMFSTGEQIANILEEAAEADDGEDHRELDLGIEDDASISAVIRLINSILQQAVGNGASDIHLLPQPRKLIVRMRVYGVLREIMSVPPKLQSGVIARLKLMADLDIAEHRLPQDGRFSVKLNNQKIDLRVASLPSVYGEKIGLRLLDTRNVEPSLRKLGFTSRVLERYEEVFRRPYGTILVTGPTGSGKSTTLYATLNELNSPEKNIIIVEDPVEYRLWGATQVQVDQKPGLTFASALRSVLRNDPDIVMVGEIRDFETAKISVEAALTGHLVLTTLHTKDAPSALNRLTDIGVEPFLTSSAVDCVVAQRLARQLCQRCKEPVHIEEEILAGMRFPFEHAQEAIASEMRFYKAVGCVQCGNSGYRGRVGIFELMVVSENIKEMVARRVPSADIGRVAVQEGMMRLRDDGLIKAAQGTTTIEEILRIAM